MQNYKILCEMRLLSYVCSLLMFCYILKIFHSKTHLTAKIHEHKSNGKSIALVPTMGALHSGHGSLVERALNENDIAVVSIFVNPTQFDNQEDLDKYPRTLEADTEFLSKISKDIIIYAPSANDIYDGEIISEKFVFKGLENEMEGRFRLGHFDGVATIVKKLIVTIMPDIAYFGEKDFQQLAIVKSLVEQCSLPVKIVGVNIMREQDGLAMSSRNARLSSIHREEAPVIYHVLKTAKELFGTKSATKITEWVKAQFNENDYLDLEYFVIADANTLKPIKNKAKNKVYRAFIAAYAGDVRLIDNIALN